MKLFINNWQVAYRMKPQGSVFEDRKTPFIPVPNTARYAAADPFVFNYDGKKYIFAELFDKKENIGKLGYSVFSGGRFTPWKVVISEKWHLSYPNIFIFNGSIYIVPEANGSGTLYAYRATDFPDKWEKCNPVITGRKLVDSTFLDYEGHHLLFTYDIENGSNKNLFIYSVDENGNTEDYIAGPVSDDDSSARPGGNFFEYNGEIIRVSQNCDGDYGKAVVFSRIKECSRSSYSEEKLLSVSADDITITGKNVSGVHTYNADSRIEVIDFKTPDYSPYTQVYRFKSKLK